jgi:small multidrug resistance pump
MNWIYLALAIVSEVVATSALKASLGFTRLVPTLIVLCGYCASFYLLSLSLRTIPLGIAYAIWSGVGLVLVTVIGWLVYEQKLDVAALSGIAFIFLGVILLSVFSKSPAH